MEAYRYEGVQLGVCVAAIVQLGVCVAASAESRMWSRMWRAGWMSRMWICDLGFEKRVEFEVLVLPNKTAPHLADNVLRRVCSRASVRVRVRH
jgi:hypothetical protein